MAQIEYPQNSYLGEDLSQCCYEPADRTELRTNALAHQDWRE